MREDNGEKNAIGTESDQQKEMMIVDPIERMYQSVLASEFRQLKLHWFNIMANSKRSDWRLPS